MEQLSEKIERILAIPPYGEAPEGKEALLLGILQEELSSGCLRHAGYENYVRPCPIDYRSASRVADLPFLPVSLLKANPPLSFIAPDEVKRTLTSSATTSQS